MNVQEILKERGVEYTVIAHPSTFSAQRMAQAVDKPGDAVAKTVVLKADGDYVLAVLQATHVVDVAKVCSLVGAKVVSLVEEPELAKLFPDCDLGAVPPFGSHYGLKTIVDRPLAERDVIVFEGNHHEEAIQTAYSDYERLEAPIVGDFSHHVGAAKA